MGTTADKLRYMANAVDDIQDAIIEKGVEVKDTDALGTYGDKIRSIEGGTDISDATLTAGKYMASGYTAYGKNGKVTGSATLYNGTSGMDYTSFTYPYAQESATSYYSGDNYAYIGFPRGIHVPNDSGPAFTGNPQYTTAVKIKTNDLAQKLNLHNHPEYIAYGKSLFGIDGTGHKDKINYYSKKCSFSEGTWNGTTLTSGSWSVLTNSSTDSSWVYYHNLSLDPSKIKFIQIRMYDAKYGFRFTRGYKSGTTTAQYQYTNQIHLCSATPKFSYNASNVVQVAYDYCVVDNNHFNSSSNGETYHNVECRVTDRYIALNFVNYGRNVYSIYSTTDISIDFVIGYTD